MPAHSDKGHTNNVASLDKLNSSVAGFGAAYNPSKVALKLIALQSLSASAKTCLTNLNTTEAAVKAAAAVRKVAFSSFDNLATRALNALIATDSSDQVDENAKTIVRKIRGQRASAKLTDTQKTALVSTKQISSSQLTFDSRIENFDRLIKLLSSTPLYIPNESELKIAMLTVYLNNIKTKNVAVLIATIALDNARIARNDLFYKPNTGLVDIGLDVKTYVKSLFGAASPQYKQVGGISFRTIKG